MTSINFNGRNNNQTKTETLTKGSIMRKFRVTFAFVVLAYSFSIAQAQGNGLKNAEKNYLSSLNHQNSGVVESAIVNCMILKLHYPDKNYKQIIKRLNELTLQDPNKIIRVKASIASNYLTYPERFKWIEKNDYKQTIKFFEYYSQRIKQQVNRTKML